MNFCLKPVAGNLDGAEILSTEECLHNKNKVNDKLLKHDNIDDLDALAEMLEVDVEREEKLMLETLTALENQRRIHPEWSQPLEPICGENQISSENIHHEASCGEM